MRRLPLALVLLAALVAGAGGCATHRPAPAVPEPGPAGIVFAADGAGNFQAASRSLREVLQQKDSPLAVHTYDWSHGFLMILADQLGYTSARREGVRLAGLVRAFKEKHPDAPVVLLGHSAGCLVALTAAESLPAGSVEQIVLLAPSVATDYDLRPALRAVRESVDVFYSTSDLLYLGFAVRILGTTDRRWTPSGGLVGFRRRAATFEDALLYNKLRQHPWLPEDRPTGNLGGHYGSYQPGYLRTRVLPLLPRAEEGEERPTILPANASEP